MTAENEQEKTPTKPEDNEGGFTIQTDALKDATPPQRKRRKRSDAGKPRRRKKDDDNEPIPLKHTLIAISMAYAERSGDIRFIMTEGEATDIEKGFNRWKDLRIPELQEYLPETYLVLPILSYVMRLQLQAPAKIPKPKPIPVDVKGTDVVTPDGKKGAITDISELRKIPITPDLDESRKAAVGTFKNTTPKKEDKPETKKKGKKK